jgi:phosphoglucosamine mutase
VLPTPAVALLGSDDSGAVISASHNPPQYNGVKFFAEGGRKLVDEEEEAIEQLIDEPGEDGGQVYAGLDVDRQYVDLVCERFGTPLAGLRLVADCANGAMFEVAPAALERLGGHVATIGNEPDGRNINVGCGATDLSLLREAVRGGDFDLGVAFDGDGDRMLAVDANGAPVDGDQILAILADHLGVDLVAVTQMTNLGFHQFAAERGIRIVTTDVGDRYVLEALRENSGLLGGEQSGHIVYLKDHVTGDGLAAALLLCAALQGRTLAEAAAVLPRFPQAKENVRVGTKDLSEALFAEIARVNEELNGSGRILVRPSGTEPFIRVLAEAKTPQKAQELCARITALVTRELG